MDRTPVKAVAPIHAATLPVEVSPPKSRRGSLLILAAALLVALAAGGGYALRSRQKSAETVAPPVAVTGTSASLPAPAPASRPPEIEGAAEGNFSGTQFRRRRRRPKMKPAPTAPPAAAAEAVKKPDAKPVAAPQPAAAPKGVGIATASVALGFDPKALDPKQNAKLKIDAGQFPANLSFTVEMNGKIYLLKADAGTKAQDMDLFVPPGVQEFRVTAKSGAIMKSSNTVSTEFKPKKKNTLKIELRSRSCVGRLDRACPQDLLSQFANYSKSEVKLLLV